MKKKRCLFLLLCFALFFMPLFAVSAEELYVSVTIPVEADAGAVIKINGNGQEPMPADNTLTILKDKGSFQIQFGEPGDYEYTLKRIDKSGYPEYKVLVSVINEEDDSLKATVVITNSKDEKKLSAASFVSTTTVAPSPSSVSSVSPSGAPAGAFVANTGDSFRVEKYIGILSTAIALAGISVYVLKNKDE